MKRNWFAWPYLLWMIVFTVIPLAFVLVYSVFSFDESGVHFTCEYLMRAFEPINLLVLYRSIALAVISTVFCLILGYPMAMILAERNLSKSSFLVALFVIPMWMNFLARTYAWMTILGTNGIIDIIFKAIGLGGFNILYTDQAVVLGMVYNFLPFMVLPIYSVLSKIDRSVVEAAEDLGAPPLTVFRRITIPQSLPGVVSGITMVFMPAVTTFVISKLLGGGQYMLIGNMIEDQFLTYYNWGFGSSLSLVLMVLILLCMGLMSRFDKENGEGGLW